MPYLVFIWIIVTRSRRLSQRRDGNIFAQISRCT